MRWKRIGDALIVDEWTPNTLAERNEKLAWLMRNRRPWSLINGQLIPRSEPDQPVADALTELMHMGRSEWKGRMRELQMSDVPLAAEGTYGALGAYPLPAALGAVTPATTTETQLLTAAQGAVYMPIPANGILAPQAYRFVLCGLTTTTATAANLTWTMRMGNSATAASNVNLGASAAIAKTVTAMTNAFWQVKGDMTVQQTGAPGLNARIVGHFITMMQTTAIGNTYISWLWGTGTTAASFDSTVGPNASANGGQFGLDVTSSATITDTFTIQQIHYMDWN